MKGGSERRSIGAKRVVIDGRSGGRCAGPLLHALGARATALVVDTFLESDMNRPIPILVTLVSLGLIGACRFPTGGSEGEGATEQALRNQERCVAHAQLECPFACALVDVDAICHADIGGTSDTQCDSSASG